MPDGLYVSVSQVKCWLRCPRQFELKYVRGAAPAFVPVALAFGTAVHEALAAFYLELKSAGFPLRLDLVLDVFRATWSRAVEGGVPLQDDEDGDDPRTMVDRGVSVLNAFYEHASCAPALVVEEVERGFVVPLRDPDSGDVLDEVLVGTWDLVAVEGGRRLIIEHKTASRKYGSDQLEHDIQPTAYKLGAREAGLGDVALRYQVLLKTKVPSVQIADIERRLDQEDDFLRIAGGVLRAVDAGVFFPVRGWHCRSCPYSYTCVGARTGSSSKQPRLTSPATRSR